MRLAIMQPYFFPYIGYFQLINAVDKLVFYDDVNYIKGGWINRNRILINNQGAFLTLSLKEGSPNKLIKEIEIFDNRQKLGKTIQIAYRKAPYFENAWPVIKNCLEFNSKKLSEIAIFSVKMVSEYLGLKNSFEISSESYSETKEKEKAERLIEICKRNNANKYFNPIGGKGLYSKEQFVLNGIQLFFIKSKESEYPQFGPHFCPRLSIIDVLMFNSKEKVLEMLNEYELE